MSEETKITKAELLHIVNNELSFYRKRIFTVYSYSLVLQLLIMTGKSAIPTSNAILAGIASTIVFVMIIAFAFGFHSSYRKRIYRLRHSRDTIIEQEKETHSWLQTCKLFPPPANDPKNDISKSKMLSPFSPGMLFIYLISLMSLLGIVLTWTGGVIFRQ
jgi:hypothetical protein